MGSEARVRSPIYLPPQVLKSHDAAAGTSTGILTWHTKDLEGEIIRPAGVRLKAGEAYRVDWFHGVYVGKGFAEHKAVRDHNADGSEVYRKVPVGTTHFFRSEADLNGFDTGKFSRAECVDAGCQAAELVLADVAPGISIEIEPLSKVYLGKSLLKPNGAYRYDDSILRGWAHTLAGGQVQPWAQTLIDKALDIGRSGKLPGGAAMLPTIRKAFDSLLAAHPKNATVTSGYTVGKAMLPDDSAPPMDPAAVDAPPAEEPGTEQQGTATAKAAYTFAQGISDVIGAIREMLKGGEHVKGKAKLTKLLEEAEALAEDGSAVGDMVASDVKQDDGEPVDEDADPADDTGADDADDEDKKTEKALKVVPLKKSLDGSLQTMTGYAPHRFSFRDVKPVEKAAGPESPAAPSFDLRHLNRRLSRIRPTRN